MKEYSVDNTPNVSIPSGGKTYYYPNAEKYKAKEIGIIESKVNKALSNVYNAIMEAKPKINNNVEDLDKQFGEEFILVNNQKLGFVDVDAYEELIKKLKEEIENAQTTASSFFGDCEENIDEINNWLKTLEKNYSDFKGARIRLGQAQKSYGGLPPGTEGYSKLQAAREEIRSYKRLPHSPKSYGRWID